MIPFVLLAMQAAGMVTDYMATKNQMAFGKLGNKLEQAGISANIAMTQAQSEDASLQSMKNLRMNLGSQAAILAARGTMSGAGSAASSMTDSLKAGSDDEQARKLNLMANINTLKAQGIMANLHQYASDKSSKIDFWKRSLNTLPMASMLTQSGKSSGMSKTMMSDSINNGMNQGFGMTTYRG